MLIEVTKNEQTGNYEVDTNVAGGSADLEANKEVSIDVSSYSSPIEITPSSGKDGMEKTTVTLTNIPSGSGDTYTFYYWNLDEYSGYFTLSENPQVGDNAYTRDDGGSPDRWGGGQKIISVSDAGIDIGNGVMSRDESEDITFTKS